MRAQVADASGRWRAGLLLALVAGGSGVALGNTGVFLAAIVGLVYAGYATLSTPPSAPLVVERTVEPSSPKPGDDLTVTVRVENVGSAPIADLRVADDPPVDLELVDGDTRQAVTVEADETTAFSYTLRASRGRHEFGDLTTVSRSVSGDGVTRDVHETAETLVCYTPVDSLELAAQTDARSGRVETDVGGEGVEFFSTRSHQPSDPASRVDWNRYAKTGELTTVTYRESRSATVVFVVDGRHAVRRTPEDADATALCSYATVRLADALLDAQNSVGVAVSDGDLNQVGTAGVLRPGMGTEQSRRIRSFLKSRVGVSVDDIDGVTSGSSATDASSDRRASAPPISAVADGGDRSLVDRIPAGAQVVFVSPLLDDSVPTLVERLAAHGHALTVISPDVTTQSTPGATVERMQRAIRLRDLRDGQRTHVVDWSPDDPLQIAIDRATERWDR